MEDHIYKMIELTGTSESSLEGAINGAIAKAAKTVHKLRWFEVTDIRGAIDGEAVKHWQVSLKLSFAVD